MFHLKNELFLLKFYESFYGAVSAPTQRMKNLRLFKLYNTRQALCSVANIHSHGYMEFIKQIDMNGYFADTLPEWVIAEINKRFYMPCDPAHNKGWTFQCRVCGNYMEPLQEWTCVTSNTVDI